MESFTKHDDSTSFESNSSGHTQYSKFGKKEDKSKHAGLAQQNGFNFWHSKSLTPAVDWLDAWIGQGLVKVGLGLLLVSYFVLFQFYG
jgi:hypothetical protein